MTTATLSPTTAITPPTTATAITPPTTTAIAAALTAELATLPTCQEMIHEVCALIAAALRLADRQRAAGRATRRALRLATAGVRDLARLARWTRDGLSEMVRVIRQVATAAERVPATAEDGETLAALGTRLVAQRTLERLREYATAPVRRPAPASATIPLSATAPASATAPVSATAPLNATAPASASASASASAPASAPASASASMLPLVAQLARALGQAIEESPRAPSPVVAAPPKPLTQRAAVLRQQVEREARRAAGKVRRATSAAPGAA